MAAGRKETVPDLSTVDVVILTWNDGDLLGRAIDSVLQSDGLEPTVIVVDNGSDPAAEVPPGTHLLRNESNVGVAAGRNQGIAAGSAPIVCLLDSDAELAPSALRRLVDELATTGADLVVPVFDGQEPAASAGLAPTLGRKVLRMTGRTASYEQAPNGDVASSSWPVEFGIGACQVFHRECWEAVGGIDESFFYGPEDVDFCLRLIDAGGEIRQVAGAPVVHPPRRRHRKPINRAGLRHAAAVARYTLRHRRRLYRWL
jgi:GT2 family glycosyltransferase